DWPFDFGPRNSVLLRLGGRMALRRSVGSWLLVLAGFAIASLGFAGLAFLFAAPPSAGLPPGVKNTQDPKDVPLTPQEALLRLKTRDGFHGTLFAGDPDVGQPIAMTFDDRGRLWVAECYSYPDWSEARRDRIVVFEDTDGDGRFDRRKVFVENCRN